MIAVKDKGRLFFLCVLFIAAGCRQNDLTTESTGSDELPQEYPLKVRDKYILNPFSGDSLTSLTNANGEIIQTGVPQALTASNWKRIPLEIHEIKAGPPYYHEPLDVTPNISARFQQLRVRKEQVHEGSISIDTLPLRINKLDVLTPEPIEVPRPKKKESASENIQLYDIEHGLKSLVLWDGLQDHLGNIWCVSEGGGISKFNGEHMQTFTKREGITTEVLLSIFQSFDQSIWFGGWGGNVMKYDGYDFYEIILSDDGEPPEVNLICEDTSGAIWLSTAGEGVFKIEDSVVYHHKESEHIGKLEGISCGSDRSFYLGGDKGIIHFDGRDYNAYIFPEKVHEFGVRPLLNRPDYNDWFVIWGYGVVRREEAGFYECTTSGGLINNRVMDIDCDQNGNIWIGTQGGLQKFSNGVFENFTESAGLSVNDVYGIHVDHQNNLWLALGGGGLAKMNQNGLSHRTKDNWLPSDQVSFITEWNDGKKIVGFWGNGLMLEKEIYHEIYKEDQGLRTNYILNMYRDGDQVYYQDFFGMGSFDGKTFRYFIIPDQTYIAYNYWPDDDSTMWIGTKQYGLIKMVDETFHQLTFPNMDIAGTYPIFGDSRGDLWVGLDEVLAKISNDSVIYYSGAEGFFNTNSIQRIAEDPDHNIWIATKLAGLFKFDGSSFTRILQGDMSQDGDVYLTVDSSHRVWLMAPFQLSVVLPEEDGHKVLIYSKKKGLVNYELSSLLHSSDGNIYVAGRDGGIDIFNVDQFGISERPPGLTISSIAVNGIFVDVNNLSQVQRGISYSGRYPFTNLPNDLNLDYQDNHISISYAGLDWSAQEDIRYSYQLYPLEDHWLPLTNASSIDYRNVPYGDFSFNVRAVGEGQRWSDIASFKFTVNPPWWHTWQAYLLYILLLSNLIYLITHLRTRSLEERHRIMEAEIKTATLEISKQKEKAEQSEKYKEQFLANMSHEIRTPLNAIIGMIKILRRKEHPDFQDLYLDAMAQSSGNLSMLLNDILDLSKIEAGKLEINTFPLKLKKIIDHVATLMQFNAEQKGLRIQTRINPQLPSYILGDPHRLSQILINLVSNGIKFSDVGAIEVVAEKTEDMVRFYVRDQGVGISQKELPNIFDSFTQSRNQVGGMHQGTGLGLSIAKQLVELQGGTMWVESALGAGSTFFFTLPLVEANASDVSVVPNMSAMREMGKKLGVFKTLLVEDDEFNMMIAVDEFQWFFPDGKLKQASDGKTAFEFWKSGDFDLIITDIHLPEIDGYKLARRIREAERNRPDAKSAVILAMTASVLKRDIDHCLQAGMNGYIPKPFQSEEFVMAILNALQFPYQ